MYVIAMESMRNTGAEKQRHYITLEAYFLTHFGTHCIVRRSSIMEFICITYLCRVMIACLLFSKWL